jgi:hypothetical protein
MDKTNGKQSKESVSHEAPESNQMNPDIYHDLGHRPRIHDKRKRSQKTMNPSTNCPHCGAGFKNHFGNLKTPFTRFECLSTNHGGTRTDLCREREARQKAEKDLETTLIVLKCSKNSHLKTCENAQREIERLLQELNAARESEAGWKTEWEKADTRRNESEAENQKLRELLERMFSAGVGRMKIEDWRKLHAEYEQLNQLTK